MEFLPYPHLIPTLFNGCGFGPPTPFTASSTWTWIDHPVSGLLLLTITALLRLGFPSAPDLKSLTSPVSVTRRTVLQKVRGRTYKVLPQLVNTGFQVLFHSPPYGVVPAYSIKVSRVSMYSGYRHVSSSFAYGTFTLSGLLSQNSSAGITESIMRSEPRNARTPVWALSISLAATLEIDFSFSSSGYLDVSVHRVPFHTLWIGVWIHEVFSCGFPHSDIHGSMDICSSP